jgi:hypothetical protein
MNADENLLGPESMPIDTIFKTQCYRGESLMRGKSDTTREAGSTLIFLNFFCGSAQKAANVFYNFVLPRRPLSSRSRGQYL